MLAFHEQREYLKDLPLSAFISGSMDFLAHWHADVEFIYILDGTQKIGINQEIKTLNKGDLAICSSGDIHYYAGLDDSAKQIVVIFRPDLIGYAAGWPYKLRFVKPIIQRSSFDQNTSALAALDRIESLLLDVNTELNQKQTGYIDAIKSKVLEICVLAMRSFPTFETEETGNSFKKYHLERMQKILQFIEDNYTGEINLEDLAEYANLSYFHFSRLFKSTVGLSFKEYVNKRRIQHAELLLGKNQLSLTEIAFECGFGSIRTFNRVYKALKGRPPVRK